MYQHIDAVTIRVATRPSTLDIPWPDLNSDTGWREWLLTVWSDDAFAAAVEVASPVLAERVDAVRDGHQLGERRLRRVVLSTMRYLLRAGTRATPFGSFAGVAAVRLGVATQVRCGHDDHAVARVDCTWLHRVITDLERCGPLARRLNLVLTNVYRIRDGRLELGPQQSRDTQFGAEPVETSLRITSAIKAILTVATSAIRYDELARTLRSEFPSASEPTIDGLLDSLVEQGLLISSLRPPMTETDPLSHVVTELTRINATEIDQVAATVRALADLEAELEDPTAHAVAATRRADTATAPLGIDTRVDLDLVLPPVVTREAERAATMLARLTPHPFGKPAWRDYHGQFLERYGVGAAVALTDLLDPSIGLGYPAGYRGSPFEPPARTPAGRDTTLLALAQTAALDRVTEVDLDDDTLAALNTDADGRAHWPPHTELMFQIHAPDRASVDRGDFALAVTGLFRAAGTTIGRFLDILPAKDQQHITDAFARLPTGTAGALPAQLSSPPLYCATENIARTGTVLPNLLPLAEHRAPGGDTIALDDLAVVGDVQRLYLWSHSRRQAVEPHLISAVELTSRTHPTARFLSEISTARAATSRPFTWGLATGLPFLPRLRHGRTILSPARWTLNARDLPDPTASWPTWAQAFTRLRDRMMVPDAVHLGTGDQRLQVDLAEPAHLHLLRTELDRRSSITLVDAPDPTALQWIHGRAHEIVLPLANTETPLPGPARPTAIHTHRIEHPPGASRWLYAKVYAHPDQHSAILATIPTLLSTWNGPVSWWFLPYRDPENRLRVRLRLPSVDAYGTAARHIGTWSTMLRGLGLSGHTQLDTYVPETGRFGTGDTMAAAEAVFAADSACALAQRQSASVIHPHALTALSMLDIAAGFLGPDTDPARWFVDTIATTPAPAPDRHLRQHVVRLAAAQDRHTQLDVPVTEAWSRRRAALAAYRAGLDPHDQPDPSAVLRSLLHLHSIRATGLSPDTERTCLRLARAAALSLTARSGGSR